MLLLQAHLPSGTRERFGLPDLRYLQCLLKNTPEDHPDYLPLNTVTTSIAELATRINRTMQEA